MGQQLACALGRVALVNQALKGFARLRRCAEARECLTTSEALLLGVSDSLTLGMLLCNRAEAEHLAGDEAAARHALRRAETLQRELGTQAESELAARTARLRATFSGT